MRREYVFDEADVLSSLRNGPLYEGQFTSAGEPEALRNLISVGLVERFYDGPSIFLGLAKVRIAARTAGKE